MNLSDYTQGTAGIFILLFAAALAIAWLFLPFLLLSRLDKMIKLLKEIESNTHPRPVPKKDLLAK
jgi:cytochrome oxidase assembly protein ShyY1